MMSVVLGGDDNKCELSERGRERGGLCVRVCARVFMLGASNESGTEMPVARGKPRAAFKNPRLFARPSALFLPVLATAVPKRTVEVGHGGFPRGGHSLQCPNGTTPVEAG